MKKTHEKKSYENSWLLPLVNKTQLSTMLSLESTLLRPTPKIANYSSYWVCISVRRSFSASPPGVREPNSIYKKHIMTNINTTLQLRILRRTGRAARFRGSSDEAIPRFHRQFSP